MIIGLLISIREKSTRLPGKVLKKIIRQNVTEHLIDRLKMASGYDKLIIATSDDPRDKIFKNVAENKNIDVFFGDQEDKLLRYLQVVKHFLLDAVIIVDGDDILCFPEIVTKTAEILKKNKCDVVFWKALPLGAACSGLTMKALERVVELKAERDTEVWGGYFTKENFVVYHGNSDIELFNHPEVRLTLDYQEDFEFFNTVYNVLYPMNEKFSSFDLMNLLINERPELLKINKGAQLKYEEHIKKAAPVKFK